jgi:hypothetical protein
MRFFVILAIFGLGVSSLVLPVRNAAETLESREVADPAVELTDAAGV